jgi:hypothetical protein
MNDRNAGERRERENDLGREAGPASSFPGSSSLNGLFGNVIESSLLPLSRGKEKRDRKGKKRSPHGKKEICEVNQPHQNENDME